MWLLLACAVALATAGVARAGEMADADVAVETAGDSLASSPTLPWYDAKTDDFRAAEVDPPQTRTSNLGNITLASILLRLGWVLLAVLLVVLVYFISRAFLNQEVRDSVVVESDAARADISRVEELPVQLGKLPADFLDEAQRRYRKGDYAQAVIYLFSHQLLQLDRRHWIRLVKGKTNRQYLRETRRSAATGAAELADLFEGTVLLFEEVFFGKRLPARNQIDAVWSNIERFEALVAPAGEQAA